MTCQSCNELKPLERNGSCASCNAAIRKAERVQLKEPVAINKVSEKRGKELNQYAVIRKKFLLGRWCAVHGKPCIPTDVHHMKGKVGFADDKEIPMLIDVRYFLAVCRDAHTEIEMRPEWAKSQGYSESRLLKI